MLIGIPVRDISYNLHGYSFPPIFGSVVGGGQISSSYIMYKSIKAGKTRQCENRTKR